MVLQGTLQNARRFFREPKWNRLGNRLHFILTEIYKTFNKTNPLFMHDLIRRKNIKYELRRKYILDVPNVNTKAFGLHSFRYLGSHVWNLLPNDLKSARNVTQFKKMCDVLNMFTI